MCRLYGFLANEPTKVDCSLVFSQNALMQQSRVDDVGREHIDGWGIATYHGAIPELIKRTSAAYSDQLFSRTAEQTYSMAIVAHVRRATVGQRSELNTHPFSSGRWVFAHNGTVTGFGALEPELQRETEPLLQSQRLGQTDSEQFFLWLLSRLERTPDRNAADRVAEQVQVLQSAVVELDRRCRQADPAATPRLNFVLTDGDRLFACRWNNSLYRMQRRGIYPCEICGIPHVHHHETVNHHAVVVASEPVTSEAWVEADNEMVFGFDLAGERVLAS